MDVLPNHQAGPSARTHTHALAYMLHNVMDLRARIYVTNPELAHLEERFTSKFVREKLNLFESSQLKLFKNNQSRLL